MHMAELRLRMLGDLEVVRGDTVLDLPPSRKTRALLAYLALSERPSRREHLCELLWEIPDDPRGSLRWSLSKIRKLVDDPKRPRIVADRSHIRFEVSDVAIDLTELHALAHQPAQELPLEQLEAAADRFVGSFLEGLDLPDFHEYNAWCVGHREEATRSQAALLRAALSRLGDDPERALVHAGRLVNLQPYDEPARARLIALLVRLGRGREAEQHYRMGVEKLREVGATESGALYRAWRGAPGGTRSPAPAPIPAAADRRPVNRDQRHALVGRDRELAVLAALVEGLGTGAGARVVLIRGDPGMGKSSLLRAAATMARGAGAGILKAAAFESEMIRPFSVWNDALRRALPDNPTSALLGSGERVTRDQVFASLSDLLHTHLAERPWVILFDDVQWADESSASALHYALRIHRRRPLLIVATAREAELQANAAIQQVARDLRHDDFLQEMRLEPLAAGDLEALISASAPGIDAARLSGECGGNPLLALELARAISQGDDATSLNDLVQDRMARLDEETRAVLQWAAVLAPRIDLDTLARVTGYPRECLEAAVTAAERQAILHPGERGFRFSHDLIGRAIYRQLSPASGQVMHRRVARMLESEAAVDLALAADLAYHAQRSGDPALAARAMVFAGRLCLRFYANTEALELYQRGLEFAAQLGDADRIRLTLELSDVRVTAAPVEDWRSAAEEYIALAEQALDHGAPAHARLGYQMASYLRWLHGQWTDARRDSLQAERVARGAPDETQILGMAEAAKCLAMLERDLSQADAMAMEASSLARRSHVQCPAVPVAMGILRYYEDRSEDAVEFLEDARTISKSGGDRINEFLANEYLAVVEVEREDYRAALARCRPLLELGARVREGSELPFARGLEALCRYGQEGDDSGLEEALQALREADAKQRLAFLLNRAARLDIRRDRLPEALARAREALELAEVMARPSEILQAHINLAEAGRATDDPEARRHLEAVTELATGAVARWTRDRAESLLSMSRGEKQ